MGRLQNRARVALLLGATLLFTAARAAEDVSVVVSGKPYGTVPAYVVGPERFLSAKEAGGMYGAQVYWYPVSGRVQMTLRGRSAQFFVNSDEARLGDKMVQLPQPVMLRSSQAWIPLKFLMSETWASWAGAETAYDAKTLILSVDKRSSLGPARWYSYRGYTRVALDLDSRLQYSVAARGVGGLEISIPFGTVDRPDTEKIDDGVISSIQLTQGPKAAKLAIRFASSGLKWKVRELSGPRRIAIDVFEGEVVEPADEARTAGQAAAKSEAMGSAPQGAPSPEAQVVEKAAAEAAKPEPPPSQLPPPVAEPPKSAVQAAPVQAAIVARRKIVVDAGHGGKDPGARGRRGIEEKDIALLAAKELAALLEEEPRFDVVLTRSDDTFLELSERTSVANTAGADLFISLHCNAASNRSKDGFEVYFLSEKASDPEAERLTELENSVVELEGKSHREIEAELLLGELAKTEFVNESSTLATLVARAVERRVDIPNRGVKQAGFYVLRGTHAPAILFEMAFLTNSKDETRLHSKRFRRKMIDGIYAGVRDYAKRRDWFLSPAKGR